MLPFMVNKDAYIRLLFITFKLIRNKIKVKTLNIGKPNIFKPTTLFRLTTQNCTARTAYTTVLQHKRQLNNYNIQTIQRVNIITYC